MKESDYIVAANQARAITIGEMLHHLIPSKEIPEAEIRRVKNLVAVWRERGFITANREDKP